MPVRPEPPAPATEVDHDRLVQHIAGRAEEHRPVGGVSAIFAARCTIRGEPAARVTSTARFTSGCATGTSGS